MGKSEIYALLILYFIVFAFGEPTDEQKSQFCPEPSDSYEPLPNYTYLEYRVGWLKDGTKEHSLRGEIFIKDKYRFEIRNFTYDGQAPSTFLIAMERGTQGISTIMGHTLYISGQDDQGNLKYSCTNLADPAYRFGNLTLTVSLPAKHRPDLTTLDIRALSIYSYEFCINFRSREIAESDVPLGPEYDYLKGEITPYCEVQDKKHRKLVADLSECKGFPVVCNANVNTVQFKLFIMLLIIIRLA